MGAGQTNNFGVADSKKFEGKVHEDDIKDVRFAFYLGEDFYRGSSHGTACFQNEQLTAKPDFVCVEMEIWGFA